MRTILVGIVAVLACSCQESTTGSRSHRPYGYMTRPEQVRMIMRGVYVDDMLAHADWITAEERSELERLRDDPYAEPSNREGSALVIPGRYWEIRGPLPISQVEQELRGRYSDEYVQLAGKHRAGDEFYYYRSDPSSWQGLAGRAGYVLIRGDVLLARIVTFRS